MDHYLEHPWNVVSGRAHFCVAVEKADERASEQWGRRLADNGKEEQK